MKEITLHKAIYDSDAIDETVSMYHDFCSVFRTEEDEYYILQFEAFARDEGITIREFCNMALMQTIKRKISLHV